MEHVTLTYKKLNSRAFDPIVPKDGIGNIQVIGYIKDIITSGTTKKVHTGISLHIQEVTVETFHWIQIWRDILGLW
jgi:hypothetical protein